MSILQSPPGAEVVIDGRRYLYFVGTGYLGLQGHPDVIRAACEATRQYGVATATSRGGLGTSPPLVEVERRAARFFGREGAFHFASGYMGNHLLLDLLADQFDAIFIDEHSHASLFDAAYATNVPVYRFLHRDAECLEACLRVNLPAGSRPLVASDGVFSALGSLAPVHDYVAAIRRYPGSILVLDDAHGVGVLGHHGWGTLEHAEMYDDRVNGDPLSWTEGRDEPRCFFTATLSKALGGFGGVLAGSQRMMEAIRRRSAYYNGASAPAVPTAAAGAAALEVLERDPNLRVRLRENVHTLRDGLYRLGLAIDDTPIPIVALALGDGANMRRIRDALLEQGIAVAYLTDYAGVGAEGILRLAVFATHTKAMIEQLVESLAEVI